MKISFKTKAHFVLHKNLLNFTKNCNKIIVDNVLIATAKITKIFYPDLLMMILIIVKDIIKLL